MRRELALPAAIAAAAVVVAFCVPAGARPAPRRPVSAQTGQTQRLRAQLRAGTLGSGYTTENICSAHRLACQAIVLTRTSSSATPFAFTPPIGYGARELERAYGLAGAPSRAGTIVVIGAGADPSLESDLGVYRSTYHLPACTSGNGCFRQVNYLGGAPYPPATGFNNQFGEEEIAVETSLDVDMASAACPQCKIISMQVPLRDGFFGNRKHINTAISHFATGVQTARSLGASAVSISYGYPTDKFSDKGAIAAQMDQPGMPIVSSSGDAGFAERAGQWPQSLTTVTSAGGTSLYPAGNDRGYSEVAWNGAGSDCSVDLPPAKGQQANISSYCGGHRAASDVSAVADPYTGVAVYDTYAPATGLPYGFLVVGGTSVASPFIGGIYARAPQDPTVEGPNTIYAAPRTDFHDVTAGTNAGLGYCRTVGIGNPVCDAGPGWDGPTGVGTPNGLAGFEAD